MKARKNITIDPDVYEKFSEFCKRRGISASGKFEQMARNLLELENIHLEYTEPETSIEGIEDYKYNKYG